LTPPRLYLNHAPELDWLIALEFGRVDEGQPPEHWRMVSESLGFLHDGPDGPVVGFKVVDYSEFDVDEAPELWDAPRFDVPALGLTAASAGEIVLATRALFGDEQTVNRSLFRQAIAADVDEALDLWLMCLQAGDSMAHYGLGYTLYDAGRHHEAYRHLRYYTEICPNGSWSWCWRGKAAEAIGEVIDACASYERAIDLEDDGSEETDARALLDALIDS
jgi:tetratricopeptide (TPR) repeat protein